MGSLNINSEALRSGFDRADVALRGAIAALGVRTGEGFRSGIEKLKELTEDGFYQATNLHSYDVPADNRADIKELIQNYWQLPWQAREIMTFEVTAGWSRDDKYHFSDLLVDLSSAIGWVTNRSLLLNDGEQAARVSQIAFCLGALLGNEYAAEEIRTYDDGLDLEQYWEQLLSGNKEMVEQFEKLGRGGDSLMVNSIWACKKGDGAGNLLRWVLSIVVLASSVFAEVQHGYMDEANDEVINSAVSHIVWRAKPVIKAYTLNHQPKEVDLTGVHSQPKNSPCKIGRH